MKLNPLLVAAAFVYSAPGLALTFAPAEITAAIGGNSSIVAAWIAQLLGAALLGLAILNWFQRYTLIGGVLGRPILVTNLLFLTASFFASLSSWRHGGGSMFLIAMVVLGLLTLAFGLRLVRPA